MCTIKDHYAMIAEYKKEKIANILVNRGHLSDNESSPQTPNGDRARLYKGFLSGSTTDGNPGCAQHCHCTLTLQQQDTEISYLIPEL